MRRTLAILGGVVAGLCLSQFPEYAQQYTQRLGGAVDELRIITQDFDNAASEAGLTRQAAIARYTATGDEFVAGRGRSMEHTFARYAELSTMLEDVRGATGWERFQRLPDYLDTDIGARTITDYKPAVPVTPEGFAYAAAGFALGYVIISALARLLMLPFRRRRPSRALAR